MISKRFVVKRLLLLVPVLLGVATFVFAILQLSPGDPAKVVAGQRASKAFVEQVRHQMGLDQPIWVQYLDFLWKALHLNLGKSYQIQKGVPVTNILLHKLPVTVELAIYGQIFGILFGIPLGVISAIKQDSATDHLTRLGALTGISVPIYWSGPLIILLFAQILHLFPPSQRIASQFSIPLVTGLITVDTLLSGNLAAFQSAVMHLFLPALVIGIYSMALISRMMRSSMLEVVRQDYIRTARAKGQGTKITMLKHGFRNALIPVITVIGIQFGTLLGGAVLTETVFGITGIGTLLVNAIEVGDFPVVQGTVLTFALLFTLVNLFVDITYSYLDPRIQQ
ncbi:peptide ABC transporter permease [Haladaptatus sp. R4]|uniref:ABC transporter permease n=1 Tax=Haladaptatus sp. R4 TaxID=1679489 RepID=UPI0007B4BB2F|nr:ABC transporter permease [Haladaptatus sp. R4]KZN24770.1 peptide ABC transporter permease [Haladaptatus sp. R4]